MQKAPHRIRRQRWRVLARSEVQAFVLRRELRERLDDGLQTALEQAFDEIAPGDEIVHLARLTIHARVASIDELAAVLPELVRRELGAAVERPPSAEPRSRRDERRSPPSPPGRLASLIEYLETGTLPWAEEVWDRAATTAWLRSVSFDEAVATGAPASRGEITEAAVARWFRLLQLVPETEWAALARALATAAPRRSRPADAGAIATPAPVATSAPEPENEGEALAEILAAIIAAGPAFSRHARLQLAAVAMAAGPRPAAVARSSAGVLPAPLAAGTPPLLAGARAALASPAPLADRARSLLQRLLDAAPPSRARADEIVPSPARSPTAIPRGASAAEEAPGLVVGCAGLTILHPFLPRLFDLAGIERASPDTLAPAMLPRAAAFLLFLATGEDEAPEHELGLIKVLLGLDPGSPLPFGAGLLTAADRDDAETLLRATIEHWAALKNTSIGGLRASFLERRGLLSGDDAQLRLQVEAAAYDVLLRHLPWSLGVIKLPWMTRPLFTEWTTP